MGHSNPELAHTTEFGWLFDYAWKLGLGRHYLG
ncbi:rpoE leader peptide RseD [Dryocola clanedunensis]